MTAKNETSNTDKNDAAATPAATNEKRDIPNPSSRMPEEGEAFIFSHGSNRVKIVKSDDIAKFDKVMNSRWVKHPALKYGVGTLIGLISGGAGYAGGVYMTNRKHEAASEPMPPTN